MKKVVVLVAILLVTLVAVVWAQQGQKGMCSKSCSPDKAAGCNMQMGGGKGMGPGPGMMMGKMGGKRGMRQGHGMGMGDFLAIADKLELTQDQKDKLQKMRETFQLDQVDRHAALQKAEIKLRGLMIDEKASEQLVLQSIDEVTRIKGEMAKTRYSHMRGMRSVLTEKQQQMLKEMRMAPGCGMNDVEDDEEDAPQPAPGGGK
jgi:hypothetical protein